MKKPVERIPYTKGEEIFNLSTHIAGGGICVVGTAALITLAIIFADTVALVACAVYGFSMIMLYTMSSLYHGVKGERVKKFFRIMDHNTIFLLIAGTYTPYTLITLRGRIGWVLFALEWVFAVIGIIFNSIDLERYKKLFLVCYVVMGWAIVVTFKPLIEGLSTFAFIFLLGGGIFYTSGLVFYGIKRRYFHSIWHIFVVLGTLFQFVSIVDIVVNFNK